MILRAPLILADAVTELRPRRATRTGGGRAVAGVATAVPLVFVAVFFWGFLWGIPGAFIGVPILITVIAICAKYPSTHWIAELLSGTAPELAKKG